ncbi:MAG: hypothetical protein ACRDTA_06555 [Pseudonocardiaceae bacterium]
MVGGSICLLLVGVSRGADHQPGLDVLAFVMRRACSCRFRVTLQQPLNRLVSDRALKLRNRMGAMSWRWGLCGRRDGPGSRRLASLTLPLRRYTHAHSPQALLIGLKGRCEEVTVADGNLIPLCPLTAGDVISQVSMGTVTFFLSVWPVRSRVLSCFEGG